VVDGLECVEHQGCDGGGVGDRDVIDGDLVADSNGRHPMLGASGKQDAELVVRDVARAHRLLAALFVLFLAPTLFATQSVVVHEPVLLKSHADAFTLCPTCVSFMGQTIDQLIEIIANLGVVGTCGKLCGYLSNSIEQGICNLLCDAVGIDEFIKLVDDADPDPIWICMEIKVCPTNDSASGNIVSFTTAPKKGPLGSRFTFTIEYNVTSDLGTGEIAIEILQIGEGGGNLLVNPALGSYGIKFDVDTKPTKNSPWVPGVYTTEVALCEGSCSSSHDHCRILSSQQMNFTITGQA